MGKEYLSLEDVAKLLGVNYQLIYKLVRSGKLPAVRVGRVYRIIQTDLDEYLENSKISSTGTSCSICGKTYHSDLSVQESCTECDAPICVDCWQRNGKRKCREHDDS